MSKEVIKNPIIDEEFLKIFKILKFGNLDFSVDGKKEKLSTKAKKEKLSTKAKKEKS